MAASKGAGTQLFFRRLKRSKDWPKDHAEGGHQRGGRKSSSLRCACCQRLLAGACGRMPAAGVLLGPLPWARAGGAAGLRAPPEYLGEFFFPPVVALFFLPILFFGRWMIPHALAGAPLWPRPQRQRAEKMMCVTFIFLTLAAWRLGFVRTLAQKENL